MIQVLFVCLGNICRSPLAEGLFQDLLKKNSLENEISCSSSGTAAYHVGERPDPRTLEVAGRHGIPIDHLGQQFKSRDFEDFDYIIAMDRSNLTDILFKGGELGKNVFLMRDFDPLEKGGEVPDPYYGGPSGFDQVFDILQRSCRQLLEHIKQHHHLND